MSTFNMLSKFLIYCIVRENRDNAEFIDVTWYIEHRHDSKAPYNRKARFRWRPDSTRVISMVLSQFRATNQTHKVWPNMDTSPLNEWHTHTDIGLVGISAWRRTPSRGTGSLTYRGTPVPHRTCITTHTRFHTSHDRAPTTLRACRSLNEPRR